MIINHTYKFIFVHVPKNAGTSVTQALSKLSTWRDLEIGGTQLGEAMAPQFNKRFGLRKHSPATQIRKVVGDDIWASYYKFGFVRDPISRVHSIWSFLRKWRDWPRSQIMNEFASIDEFVRSEFFRNGGPDEILKPQVHFLDAELDFLGLCSRTEYDFSKILESLSIPQPKRPSLGTLNDSNSKPVPLAHDSMRILRDYWAADFELMDRLQTAN